ncbi:MAG: ATP-binding protein [Sulfurospirillaceae bacterium]|nr:ATP-binding protein [Sulfurospirillaceae bacterium]
MLVEFTVKNFRSFHDETQLSMVAANKKNLDNSIVLDENQFMLLQSAVIYGANGAGKSNLIKAFNAMQHIVLSSAKEQRGDQIKSIEPFIFDENSRSAPTLFEVIFIVDAIRYQYGFSATKTKIMQEWLYAFPKAAKRTWFERLWNEESQQYIWVDNDGKYLKANKNKMALYKDTTRDNELFLSKIVQLNNKEVTPIFDWFNNTLKCAGIDGWNDGDSITRDFIESQTKKQLILQLLHDMDIGIDDIKLNKEEFDVRKLPDEVPSELKQKLESDLKGKILVETQVLRTLSDKTLVPLNLEEESDGTQKLFSLLGPFLDALENGYIVVIDELHNSLHPLLLRYLVSLFHDENINQNNAQLIFTTHETEILSQEVFRRDQIWFCEKDRDFNSTLVPLTDYQPRKNVENLSKGYLSGRYGGIPAIEKMTKEKIQKLMGM